MQDAVFVFGGLKNLGVRFERRLGSNLIRLSRSIHGAAWYTAFVFLLVNRSIAIDFDLAPFGQKVNDRDADAVQTA